MELARAGRPKSFKQWLLCDYVLHEVDVSIEVETEWTRRSPHTR